MMPTSKFQNQAASADRHATASRMKNPALRVPGLEPLDMFDSPKLPQESGSFKSISLLTSDRSKLAALLKRGQKERFVEMMDVTPAMAREMVATSAGNRPTSDTTILKYAELMKAGKWAMTTEALAFNRLGQLQNGHHRLAAIYQSGVTLRMTVWFGTDPDEFSFLDGGKSRTASDLIALNGLDRWQQRASLSRVLLTLSAGTYNHIDRMTVTDHAVRIAGEQVDASILASEAVRKIMSKTPAALAHYTISNQSAKAVRLPAFWDILRNGMGEGNVRPVVKLRDICMKTGSTNKRLKGDGIVKDAAYVIMAWNAYVSNRAGGNFVWNKIFSLPDVL